MKKYIAAVLMGAAALSPMAQDNPNRFIITHADGTTQSMMIDRVTDMTFATVNGPVKADVEYVSSDLDNLTVSFDITMSPDCVQWRYIIVPAVELQPYDTDAKRASYINAHADLTLRDQGPMTADYMNLMPGSDYAIATVGIDAYGTLCETSVATFQTERVNVGAPDVSADFTNVTESSFEVTLTPNSDCSFYRYVIDSDGQIESYYNEYGQAFGASSIEELIVTTLAFENFTGPHSETVTKKFPAMVYTAYIVPYDKDGNMGKLIKRSVKTLGGGDGPATVSVAQADYSYNQKPDPATGQTTWVPFQAFNFTPDANCARYRAEVFTEDEYARMGEVAAFEAVRSEAPAGTPDDLWFRYGDARMIWEFAPDSTGYVLTAGKNANGEWGEVTVSKFTTPSEPTGEKPW